MDIELVDEATPPNETPPELRYVRRIFSCKLLLSAVVIPIAISAIIEVPHLYDDAASQFQATPILATLFFGSFYLAIALFFLAAFAAYIPIFGALCFAPLLSILWQLTMFTIGLLVDTIFITPRVFLGSAIDSLLLPQSADRSHLLFSNKTTNVLYLLLFVPIAATTYLLWHPFYSDYLARTRQEYDWKHYRNLTAEESRKWQDFHQKIREAERVQTVPAALTALWRLRESIPNLPYREEEKRQLAYNELDGASKYLNSLAHDDTNWHKSYRMFLLDVPRYWTAAWNVSESGEPELSEPATPSVPPTLTKHKPSKPIAKTSTDALPNKPASTIPPDSDPHTPLERRPTRSSQSEVITREPIDTTSTPVREPTTRSATPQQPASDEPNPFRAGTTWVGMSFQVSDGGINPSQNNGAQIRVELTITRLDAEQFEGIVRCPWVIDAQGRRVRWGATASARGTCHNGKVTMYTTPSHVPAGTVLLPGTWTATGSDDVFTGEFKGTSDSLSQLTLKRQPSKRQSRK